MLIDKYPGFTLLMFISFQMYAMTLVQLHGTEYITWDITRNNINVDHLRLVFQFRTIDPSGLILFSYSQESGDFISLELIDGHLRFKSQLGLFDDEKQEILLGSNLNSHNWHTIDINIKGTTSSVEILEHNLKNETTVNGQFKRLDLDNKVYVGGVDDYVDVVPFKITKRKFSGCLKNLQFNDTDILYNAKYSRPNFVITGDVLWGQCDDLNYSPITFPNPQDFALLPTFIKTSMNIVFKFRTHIEDGLLFSKISRKLNVYLILEKGMLIYKVVIHGKGPIVMKQGKNLHDGIWHRVEILVSTETINVKLDKKDEVTYASQWAPLIEFDMGNATLGGGAEQVTKGFTGCIYDVWVDNTGIYFRRLGQAYLQGAVGGCSIKDRCLFSPCQNGGKCIQDHKSFYCDCVHTMYDGKFCEKSLYQPSCQEYKNLGMNEDSYCIIDPDGNGGVKPREVLCNMTKYSKKAVTIFRHNLGSKEISVRSGVFEENSFIHSITYGTSMEDFDVLLNSAESCKQYVKFNCRSAYLMTPLPDSQGSTIWIGRLGTFEHYWGGGKPDSGTCACYTNRSCAQKFQFCNCDFGDDVRREDSGYFRETDRLPVFELRFPLKSNQSNFTIGNLECEYKAQKDISKIIDKIPVLKSCRPMIQPVTKEPVYTLPKLDQKEKIINYNRQKSITTLGPHPTKRKIVKEPRVPNVNVNVTVELPKTKSDSGFKLTISIYATIVIAIATITISVVIAIVMIYRKHNRRNTRHLRDRDSLDDDLGTDENTEMCTFFGSLSTRSYDRNRPVLEIHRHSIHCDALDEIPPAYRQYTDYNDFSQPIHTHIDLSYKTPKRGLGIFC